MCVPPAICQVWGRPPGPAASWKLLCQSSGNLPGWQWLLDRRCRFLHPWPRCAEPLSQTCTPKQPHLGPQPHLPLWKPQAPPPHPSPILTSHCGKRSVLYPLTSPSLTLPATRGGRLRGAARPSHCHPRGPHAAHHSCCPRFLLRQEEVMTSPILVPNPLLP